MQDSYENFNNLETSYRKSSVIHERINLVSSHMYKQFLDYQHATMNTNEVFSALIDDLQNVVEALKQSFAARGVTTQNIYVEVDAQKSVAILNILWYKISFTTRGNYQPQALIRKDQQPLISCRIMALMGSYNDILKKNQTGSDEMKLLLEHEVASLFIPAEKVQPAVITIQHLGNKEIDLNLMDASKEFVLKVVEIVCRGGISHEMGKIKSFNI